MRKATFGGTNMFLSRNLVPPEVYDAVHDALKLNGAQVFLCCDPSRNSPDDYHIISSPDHEKFEVLKSKGCNLIGPQCVLSCANEHRILPKQGYTCCLAMDGVKVLASGFERDQKATIEKLVTAMGGILQTKPSPEVNFVIVKDVLAAKYKHALKVLKKPIVNIKWLFQCWTEHRVVPQEPFRILPFTGLTVCVTRIPPDERKEIEKLIVKNGGCYSADLTKKCTHLVSDAPVGDKYLVAQRWGHIHIVTRKWVDHSIAKRGCLDEELYPVDRIPKSCNGTKDLHNEQHPELSNVSSQPASRPVVEDLEAMLSQNITSSFSDAQVINVEDTNPHSKQMKDEPNFDCHVAEDSETEDNDLYLSNCRIFLVGFEEKEQPKLINMIRKGGGTRHMLLSEKLTHIIIGAPSEEEKREIRRIAAWGVIQVVRSSWLEECDRTRRELPVTPRHIASELLCSKESSCNVSGAKKLSTFVPSMPGGLVSDDKLYPADLISDNRRCREKSETGINDSSCAELTTKTKHSIQSHAVHTESKKTGEVEPNSCTMDAHISSSSGVFKEKSFSFSSSFPVKQRDDVIRWIKQGGGVLVDDQQIMDTDFIVERHGLFQSATHVSQSTIVSTHWIKSSLDDGFMLDIKSHIIYSPLRCHIPLPGFELLRFCVSQYDEKDKLLLKNLCVAVGARCSFKLSKKSTHLLCKFTNGPKYEAACNWGIESVTAEWIIECITQDKMVPLNLFRPRPVSAEEIEAGLCTISQYTTQAANMVSSSVPSQLLTQSHGQIDHLKATTDKGLYGKRPRLPESDSETDASRKKRIPQDVRSGSNVVPDVADAIEDLLAQSTMIQDMKLPGTSCCDQTTFSPDHSSILGQNGANSSASYGITRHWLNRTEKPDRILNPVGHEGKIGAFDSFSETQTESQVVVYEEDLTGRQKIIDRVRSQNLTLTPDK